jgi:hypothetical protein
VVKGLIPGIKPKAARAAAPTSPLLTATLKSMALTPVPTTGKKLMANLILGFSYPN